MKGVSRDECECLNSIPVSVSHAISIITYLFLHETKQFFFVRMILNLTNKLNELFVSRRQSHLQVNKQGLHRASCRV